MSLQQGSFPETWKTAIVTPLLKKSGLPLELCNYRPISNLSYVSKLIESASMDQLTKHLAQHSLASSQNSAYKKGHSTETLITKVHSDILMAMDERNVVLLVMLDLSAAFDTVDYPILHQILENKFGLSDNVMKWVVSYLCNRKLQVQVEKELSHPFPLECGVPQGSCAGPILFLCYLSSLYDVIARHLPSVGGYADDHQLYLSFKPGNIDNELQTIHAMSSCITDIRVWMLTHKLKINDNKTEVILLGSSQMLSKVNIESLTVGNDEIKTVSKVKNLGVIFDENMSMDCQVNNICSKAYSQLYKLNKIKHYVNKTSLEKLVHAFVTSHLDYCNSILYGIPKYQLQKLQRIQNSAARLITDTKRSQHISPILKNLHWLKVEHRIFFKIILLTFKARIGLAPSYINDLLIIDNPSRSLRSVHQYKYKIPRTKSKTIGNRSFYYAAPLLWNSLPFYLRETTDLNHFKTHLKTYLFNMCYSS